MWWGCSVDDITRWQRNLPFGAGSGRDVTSAVQRHATRIFGEGGPYEGKMMYRAAHIGFELPVASAFYQPWITIEERLIGYASLDHRMSWAAAQERVCALLGLHLGPSARALAVNVNAGERAGFPRVEEIPG